MMDHKKFNAGVEKAFGKYPPTVETATAVMEGYLSTVKEYVAIGYPDASRLMAEALAHVALDTFGLREVKG